MNKIENMNKVLSKSYTLRDANGVWLGQIVLTSDGMFASVTDYGNLSYAWKRISTIARAATNMTMTTI